MSETEPSFRAFLLDGKGGCEAVDAEGGALWTPEHGVLWIRFDGADEEAGKLLEDDPHIGPVSAEALVAEDPRPRSFTVGDQLIVLLRGVNLNPGSDPEDMVSLRMCLEPNRIITLRNRKVFALDSLAEMLAAGRGPTDTQSFLAELMDCLLHRISEVVENVDDQVDSLEDSVLESAARSLRPQLGAIRRNTIALRRYIAPQRDSVLRLHMEKVAWLDDRHRAQLREDADRLTRLVEDLDSARDRAAVTQEELSSRMADQLNKTMYVIAIVSLVFIPLGLLTGLLGINVGGMPGADSPYAFWFVCGLMAAFLGVEYVLLKKLHWL